MKKDKRFLAVGLCALLSVLFVFSANVFTSEVSTGKTSDAYYERVADSGYGDSGGWIDRDEDESMKDDYEQEYKERAGERDDEYESIPSDSQDESSTEEPSVEGDFPQVQEDQYL
jgi:hypothetical protein